MMGRPELGTKCTCTGCQERFYDLNRAPATCPKCGAKQPPARPYAARRPSGGGFGSRLQPRHAPAPVIVDDDDEPGDTLDVEAEVDEADDDDEDDIDVDVNFDKPAV